jgi:hypothetical protein
MQVSQWRRANRVKRSAATFPLCKKSWKHSAHTGGGRCLQTRVTIASAYCAAMDNLATGRLVLQLAAAKTLGPDLGAGVVKVSDPGAVVVRVSDLEAEVVKASDLEAEAAKGRAGDSDVRAAGWKNGTYPFGTPKMRMDATHFLMKRLLKVASEMAPVMNIVGVKPLIAAMKA